MNLIEEYLSTLDKLKGCNLDGFNGYEVDKLFTIPIQEIVLENIYKQPPIKFLRNVIVQSCTDGYAYDFSSIRNKRTVLFYSHLHAARMDYVQFMEKVASTDRDAVLFTGKARKGVRKKFHFDFFSFFSIWYIQRWRIELKDKGISQKFIQKLLIGLVSMYRWKKTLEKNETSLSSIHSFISIFDAREFENLLTQFLNKRGGIVTATLQHGHFGKMSYVSKQDCYLDIAYKGCVSDYFLAWGEYSKENAIEAGLNPNQIIVAGCPDFINTKDVKGKKKAIGVLLDGGPNAIEDNLCMLEIGFKFADENQYSCIVKLHPSDKIENYPSINQEKCEIFKGSVYDFANKTEFSICGNSSVLIQMLSYHATVYHYEPRAMYDMYPFLKPWSFNTYDRLLEIMEQPQDYKNNLARLSKNDNVKETYHDILCNLSTYPKIIR
ncbi:MAG: hypothetical protein KBT27_04985 [Prevotellaceae bacterium]|nr:hypothetical protein [Candidatus Faecinaster equi]